MNEAIRFLHAFAQTLSARTLYTPGHPATRRSVEQLWDAVSALLAVDPNPVFLFLGTAPVHAGRALHDLREWHHSARLAAVGVQRLEFDPALTRESLVLLVEQITQRLATGHPGRDEAAAIPGVTFGAVAVQEEAIEGGGQDPVMLGIPEATLQLDLGDELDVMEFVRSEAVRGVVARSEAEAVVQILNALVDRHRLPQAIQTADPERFHLVHPVNTALLAMTVASEAGVHPEARRQIGTVALLHDIGMALLPPGIADMDHSEELERAQFETHVVSGASLLLEHGGTGFDLAAVVAYEHHLRPDGKGYPVRRFEPVPHWASRLVGCCAALTALRAPRPDRAAWPLDRALRYIGEGAGTEFDAEIAALVTSVVRAA